MKTASHLFSLCLLSPLAALLLSGCATYSTRFDQVSVVSLNPLNTEEFSPLSERDCHDLEGSWVATNSFNLYERQKLAPTLTTQRPATNELSELLPNALPKTQQGVQKPQHVEVVTTLVIQANTNLANLGLCGVAIESQRDGKMESRTAYLGLWIKIKDLLFLDLSPDELEDSSCIKQAMQQHFIPTHWFLKVEAKGKTLEIGRINETWLCALLEKRPRSLGHASGIPQVLTDSPEAMQRFLQRHARNPEAFMITTFHRNGGTP